MWSAKPDHFFCVCVCGAALYFYNSLLRSTAPAPGGASLVSLPRCCLFLVLGTVCYRDGLSLFGRRIQAKEWCHGLCFHSLTPSRPFEGFVCTRHRMYCRGFENYGKCVVLQRFGGTWGKDKCFRTMKGHRRRLEFVDLLKSLNVPSA